MSHSDALATTTILKIGRLAVGLGLVCASALCSARIVTICISQNPVPPLTYPDRESEAQTMVRRAVEHQGDTVSFVVAPWMRCRLGLKSGIYVAAMPLAATPSNLTDFSLPLKNGDVDRTRNVGSLTIGVVRRIGSTIHWDGVGFSNLTSPVMVLPGQMNARDKLQTLGVSQDAESTRAESLLHKLALGRGELAVLPVGIIEEALKSEEFRNSLEMLHTPLTSDMTFVGFNREFERAEPGYTKAVWTEVARMSNVRNHRAIAQAYRAPPRRVD